MSNTFYVISDAQIGSDCLIINEDKIYSRAPKNATYIVSYILKIGL